MIDKTTTSKYMGAKTNGLSIIITGITVPEIILYLAVIINLMFSLAYPVYNAIHEYYHFINASFSPDSEFIKHRDLALLFILNCQLGSSLQHTRRPEGLEHLFASCTRLFCVIINIKIYTVFSGVTVK